MLLAVALVLAACGPSDRRDSPATQRAPSTPPPRGPEPVVLRVARDGGTATASIYPALDSIVWRSASPVPALERVLGFDREAGLLAFVDRRGRPGRIDLRLGRITTLAKPELTGLTSADGANIYGIAANGDVVRLAPTGDQWTWTPPQPARQAVPLADGWLVVISNVGTGSGVWRLRPPEKSIVDSLALPRVTRGVTSSIGDRVYFVVPGGLAGARSRGLQPVPRLALDRPPQALAITPSGDRVFVVTEGETELLVVDRYDEGISARIALPGVPRDLRMDPMGRSLLVRAAGGDSAWVVAVGTGTVLGTVRTAWRSDLPFVAPDGGVALARDKDVVFTDGESLAQERLVAGGAADFWYGFLWDGFRPRAGELDDPVHFRDVLPPPAMEDSLADSTRLGIDSTVAPPPSPRPDSAARPPAAQPPARPSGYIVSFATLLSEASARERAAGIRVDGQPPRVVASPRAGTMIYRVMVGPFPTREEAERVGRASGASFVIVEGTP